MTKEAMRRLVSEILSPADRVLVEVALKEIMQKELLDPRMIAGAIWLLYRDELTEAAAEVVAEEILPF
jgi:hypothetical protein